MNPTVSVPPLAEKTFKKSGMRDSALLLLLAWITPIAINSIPWAGPLPLAAYLIPMFWAEAIAVYLHGFRLGLLIGLTTPLITFAIAGFPDLPKVALLTVQLIAFAAIARLWILRAPRFRWGVPASFVISRAMALGVQAMLPALQMGMDFSAPQRVFATAVIVALPGLFVLTLLHFALVKSHPQPDDWDAT